jgi:hypothetical protein
MQILQSGLNAWQLILHLLVILLILHLLLCPTKATYKQLRCLEQTPLDFHDPILLAP